MAQWSPDGRWIILGRRTATTTELVLMPPLGGPQRLVATSPLPWVFWTPDSKALTVTEGSPSALVTVSIDDGSKKTVVGPLDGQYGSFGGVISPDGKAAAVLFDGTGHTAGDECERPQCRAGLQPRALRALRSVRGGH